MERTHRIGGTRDKTHATRSILFKVYGLNDAIASREFNTAETTSTGFPYQIGKLRESSQQIGN